MILGIDASTKGSGGAKRHLLEILSNFEPNVSGFDKILICGVQQNLDNIPNYPWIIKVSHPFLNKNLFYRTIWQLFIRNRTFNKSKIDVLFCPFGTYVGTFKPYVTMSRNMLIFDKKEKLRFGWSLMRLKLILLKYTQIKSFNSASGIIFISEHAENIITSLINKANKKVAIIHHGVSSSFNSYPKKQRDIKSYDIKNPFKFLYVSSIWIYKHQWNVAEAVKNLRLKGYPVTLEIVGSGDHKFAAKKLTNQMELINGNQPYIFWHQNIGLNDVASYYKSSDAFVFASTCENMPNILIEAMSSGLPIVCSNYLPMPQFLKDCGLYIDPLSVANIEITLETLILNANLREKIASLSFEESLKYSWSKCANETFTFLSKITYKEK